MKKGYTNLDEHLESLAGMQEASTDDFFYTRLKARLTARHEGNHYYSENKFGLKPVWTLVTLVFLLLINGLILTQQSKTKLVKNKTSSSLQQFAQSYDQTISSY